jgi:hypothetical protein
MMHPQRRSMCVAVHEVLLAGSKRMSPHVYAYLIPKTDFRPPAAFVVFPCEFSIPGTVI